MLPLKTLTTEAPQQASHNSKVMSLFNWKAWHPKQHCNRCLNHFFPALVVIPLKAHAFHFPINYRQEHLAFS